MNTIDRYFEDFELGETRRSTGRTVTEADIVIHAGQTGDFFPHHMDAEWAKTQPIGARIAHGTLILSIGVGMTAGDINPQAMSYGYDHIRFIAPVYIGDTISVTAEITEKHDHAKQPQTFGYVHELVTISNQHDEVVLILTHLYLVNKRAS
ncbi:MAG TPA: MaoC/PaaZ C-terminal domain-containing protein [Galbitalea sp.]|jgi:acyl dehydratase|nr:MaoC/PaaZ C-terminal domain-containing protein [Galbitalea sp.]